MGVGAEIESMWVDLKNKFSVFTFLTGKAFKLKAVCLVFRKDTLATKLKD